jgi:hypothetical protein
MRQQLCGSFFSRRRTDSTASKNVSRRDTVKPCYAGTTNCPVARFPSEAKAQRLGPSTDRLNRLRKKPGPGRKDVPQGLNHEWPPHGQLFGTAYATFFTESRRHLARGAQLNRPFVAAHDDYIAFTPGINPRPTLKPSVSAACKARDHPDRVRLDSRIANSTAVQSGRSHAQTRRTLCSMVLMTESMRPESTCLAMLRV